MMDDRRSGIWLAFGSGIITYLGNIAFNDMRVSELMTPMFDQHSK
jgi:hypothetical protein